MIELQPCPFCGGTAMFGRCAPEAVENADDGAEYIECENCGAATALVFPCMDDAKHALADRWNKRHNVGIEPTSRRTGGSR